MTRGRTLQWLEAGIFLGGMGALGNFKPIVVVLTYSGSEAAVKPLSGATRAVPPSFYGYKETIKTPLYLICCLICIVMVKSLLSDSRTLRHFASSDQCVPTNPRTVFTKPSGFSSAI
jgi:hypothetical protein